jgi:predicted acetyltransferase
VGVDIRQVKTDEELEAFVRTDLRSFGASFSDDSVARARRFLELDRTRAAFDEDGAVVGCSAALSWEVTVPGGASLPSAAVTWVSVRGTHRRQGLLRSMMAALLDDAVARNEPLAMLFASESVIYGRFGYGTATFGSSFEIERPHATLVRGAAPAPGRLVLLERAEIEPIARAVFDEHRRQRVGEVSRSEAWWQSRFEDRPDERGGASNLFYVAHERSPGVWDGYAMYRMHEKWDGAPDYTLDVVELVALEDDARAALVAYLLDVDLVGRIRYGHAPVDDPLRWSLADPRRLRTTSTTDMLWLRVLDVTRALSARTYAVDDRLVLEVHDAFRPDAGGRFVLEDGVCSRTDTAEPDLVLGASELGSLYLGGAGVAPLVAAGLVRVREPSVVARATAMFRTDPAPHCHTDF